MHLAIGRRTNTSTMVSKFRNGGGPLRYTDAPCHPPRCSIEPNGFK